MERARPLWRLVEELNPYSQRLAEITMGAADSDRQGCQLTKVETLAVRLRQSVAGFDGDLPNVVRQLQHAVSG